jgi:hypothetical protein
MVLGERADDPMQNLEVSWKWRSGQYGVWIVEHLFGSELHFGKIYGETWCTMRQMPLPQPWDFVSEDHARSAVIMWEDGDYRGIGRFMSDAASLG